MLFNVLINEEVVNNKDKLVEKLYIFLHQYVPTRLKYESRENIEDCIQDTIMHMLKRYDKLEEELIKEEPNFKKTFNFSKYFYNRARSYISYWIRRVNKRRQAEREYLEAAIYFKTTYEDFDFKPLIDYRLLAEIATGYNLGPIHTDLLLGISEDMLSEIGFEISHKYALDKLTQQTAFLALIANTVIDEYIVLTGDL